MKSFAFSRKMLLVLGLVVILGVGSVFAFFKFNKQAPMSETPVPLVNTIPLTEAIAVYLNDLENNKDPDFIQAKKALESGDIKNAPDLWEKVVQKDSAAGKYQDSTKSGVDSKLLLVQTYLQHGNYYYQEKEDAQKALGILAERGEEHYGSYGYYFIGYSYEITKQYEKALEYYNKGLTLQGNTDAFNAVFQNQIGHVYDLQGDVGKAYEHYREAYQLDRQNYYSAVNIGRFLARTKKTQDSVQYFEYGLQTSDLALKAEIYYTLSSLQFELEEKPDIDKAISLAKEGIKTFPDYPMGYVALARGLYMKNDKQYDKELENALMKSIQLNPNGFAAYKYYALHVFDGGDVNSASTLLAKSNEVVDKDVILMSNMRENERMTNTMIARALLFLDKVNKEGVWSNKEAVDKFLATTYFEPFVELQKKRVNNGVLKNLLK